MQTGRIKIVLYVDGHWAYNYPTDLLKKKLGDAANKAVDKAYDKLEPIKSLRPIEAEAWPEHHDDQDL
jgi:hypothetical protein